MVPPRFHFRYVLRVIKLLVFLLPLGMIVSACVELSSAGAQVRVLKAGQEKEVSACQLLGQVSVSSEDALRNATAAMSGDTALMSVREAAGNFYIRGNVYRCKQEASMPMATSVIQGPIPAIQNGAVNSAPVNETEAARKSAKCHEKGGLWTHHQCVIEIE